MKILLFANQGISVPHQGIELEILEELMAGGHEIFIVKCGNQLESCYANPCHNLVGCAICEARNDVFYQQIKLPADHIFFLKQFPEAAQIDIPFFADLNQLFDFTYEGINVGRGVASSIISAMREYEISSHKYQEIIEVNIRMSVNVLLNFTDYIRQFQPDRLYFFNGRFAEVYPLIGLAEKHGIDYYTFEKGAWYDTYDIFENTIPHSIKARQDRMDYYWQHTDPKEREATSIEWFEGKLKGVHATEIIYTGDQEKNTLPEGFDPDKQNIVFFNSSEDEFKAIAEWQHALYRDQNEAIRQTVEYFRGEDDYRFYLRVHPNLRELDNTQTRGIEQMDYPNLTVIPAASPIDTYALMQAADKVITFGSRTGVEATYLGVPSILYGKAFHMEIDCVYVPRSFEALVDLIKTPQLPPKDKRNTYPYAFYLGARGTPFRFFQWGGKTNSAYRGVKMKRFYPQTLVNLFRFLPRLPHWLRMNRLVKGRGLRWQDILRLKEKNVLK